MIGEQWDTLVAPPTERELEAAMAAVRVRALEHWKRRIWRGRALLAAAFVLVGTAGMVGGRSMGNLFNLAPEEPEAWSGSGFRSSLELGRLVGTAAPGDLRRFHIARRTEMDGVTINEGSAWIEGPDGTAFSLSVGHERERFTGTVSIMPFGDSMTVNIAGQQTRLLGYTDRGGRVVETLRIRHVTRARAGQQLVFYPFGEARDPDGAQTVVHIDGPWAPLPTSRVRWRTAASDSVLLRWRGNTGSLDPYWLAVSKDIRYTVDNIVSVGIRPRWISRRPAALD